ncbi:hypothetical protein ACHAXT_004623 [Thalassiosira profunda]
MSPFAATRCALAAALLLLTHRTHGFATVHPRCVRCTPFHPTATSHVADARSSSRCSLLSSDNDDEGGQDATTTSVQQRAADRIASNPARSVSFSILMAFCGAALGPFLDSYHSLFGWVPPLFGLAGFLIGWLYVLLDAALPTEEEKLHPVVPKVLVGISFFTFQYWLSGTLSANHVDRTSMLAIMSALAAGGFVALDATASGLIASLATAIGGPLIEVGLISSLPESLAYHYTDPGETGFFPLWILPVYFLGGPANGNLARAFWDALGNEEESASEGAMLPPTQKAVPCSVCNGTRAVPCPNCDGVGTYVAYGELVTCRACRGKGRVICRSCFSEYGDDPNDIENIRRIMDQMPD